LTYGAYSILFFAGSDNFGQVIEGGFVGPARNAYVSYLRPIDVWFGRFPIDPTDRTVVSFLRPEVTANLSFEVWQLPVPPPSETPTPTPTPTPAPSPTPTP
jgi:hypothetical protein